MPKKKKKKANIFLVGPNSAISQSALGVVHIHRGSLWAKWNSSPLLHNHACLDTEHFYSSWWLSRAQAQLDVIEKSFAPRKEGRLKPSTGSGGWAARSGVVGLMSSGSSALFFIQRCPLLAPPEGHDPTKVGGDPHPGFYWLLLSPVSLFPPSELWTKYFFSCFSIS